MADLHSRPDLSPRPDSSLQSAKHRLDPTLQALENEAIHIFREVAAEFERPVMLYSVGKDSSVLLHLARKAFYPGKVPFPLLHIDTGWKFTQMLAFRDQVAQEHNLDLMVYTNPRGANENITPFTYGSSRYTDIMKTEALRTALDAGKFDAAFGGARRDEEAARRSMPASSTRHLVAHGAMRKLLALKSGSIPSARPITHGIRAASARSFGPSTTA
jgi:sulfate adenylyltransferase subunit 2